MDQYLQRSIGNDAFVSVTLYIATDYKNPDDKTPACFMYMPSTADQIEYDQAVGDSQVAETETTGRMRYVRVCHSASESNQDEVERTMQAPEMASGVADLRGWVLSRTAPSGHQGAITNDDEEAMVREQLIHAAAVEWEDGDTEHTSRADFKGAVAAHLDSYLHFTSLDPRTK